MAITPLKYISIFPPPVPKQNLCLPASNTASKSAYTPLPDTFASFSLLPYELQHQIWTEAAKQWIQEYLERINTWTVDGIGSDHRDEDNDNHGAIPSSNCLVNYGNDNTINESMSNTTKNIVSGNSKRIFLIHIKSNPLYRRQSPNLLWTCLASRAVLYGALLTASLDKSVLVPRGRNVHLFLRRCVTPIMGLGKPGILGCRIQDFRHAGLQFRVEEEERRIEQMGKEIGEVIAGAVVDEIRAHRGYVRLPFVEWVGEGF